MAATDALTARDQDQAETHRQARRGRHAAPSSGGSVAHADRLRHAGAPRRPPPLPPPAVRRHARRRTAPPRHRRTARRHRPRTAPPPPPYGIDAHVAAARRRRRRHRHGVHPVRRSPPPARRLEHPRASGIAAQVAAAEEGPVDSHRRHRRRDPRRAGRSRPRTSRSAPTTRTRSDPAPLTSTSTQRHRSSRTGLPPRDEAPRLDRRTTRVRSRRRSVGTPAAELSEECVRRRQPARARRVGHRRLPASRPCPADPTLARYSLFPNLHGVARRVRPASIKAERRTAGVPGSRLAAVTEPWNYTSDPGRGGGPGGVRHVSRATPTSRWTYDEGADCWPTCRAPTCEPARLVEERQLSSLAVCWPNATQRRDVDMPNTSQVTASSSSESG